MAMEDQDILDQIAELRRQKAAELQAMQSDNNPLGLIVAGGLGGIADVFSAGAGGQSAYAKEGVNAYQTAAKGQRDMRMKALEGSGEEIKALNALAQSRATDRRAEASRAAELQRVEKQIAGHAAEGEKNRQNALSLVEAKDANKVPKGMKAVIDPETGDKTFVQEEGSFKPSQYQAATYGSRATQAETVLDKLANTGFDPTSGMGAVDQWLATGMTRGLATPEAQQSEQAQRNFVNAILRRESGAAISKDEFASANAQYFPKAGDSPEVLAQKAMNRRAAIAGLQSEAGGAYGEVQKKLAGLNEAAPAIAPKQARGGGLIPEAQAGAPKLSTSDIQALMWAQSNPNDPRSAEILKRVQSKGL